MGLIKVAEISIDKLEDRKTVKKESKEPVKKVVVTRKEEPGYEQLSLFGLAGI